MPSHQERVRGFNMCPFCNVNLADGRHTTDRIGVNDYYAYMIYCSVTNISKMLTLPQEYDKK